VIELSQKKRCQDLSAQWYGVNQPTRTQMTPWIVPCWVPLRLMQHGTEKKKLLNRTRRSPLAAPPSIVAIRFSRVYKCASLISGTLVLVDAIIHML
jgi:hypothetical protein